MRWIPLVLVAAIVLAGCQPQAVWEGVAAAGSPLDPYTVLLEAIHSSQPPLQALAAETFLEADRQPPRAELILLAETPDPRVRTTGLALAGTTRRQEFLRVAQQQYRDPQAVVRVSAAFAMAMLGDTSRIGDLRDGLASPDVTVRRTAVWLLGLMGNRSAVGMLWVKLTDPDAVVVLRTAEALHRLGSSNGVGMVRAMTEHSQHSVRAFATRLLGRVGEKADIPRLERLYQSRFLDVKFAAIGALAQLGDFKRIGMLVDFLDSEDQQAGILATRELAETGYRPALEKLEGRLKKATDPMERATVAAAMVRILSARESWRSRILADEKPPALGADAPARVPTAP
ncbi:MAG: HEAT repeat domain-containing protein [Phycisphaerae bacterium]